MFLVAPEKPDKGFPKKNLVYTPHVMALGRLPALVMNSESRIPVLSIKNHRQQDHNTEGREYGGRTYINPA